MITENVHDSKVGFRSDAKEAAEWMKKGLSREGAKKLLEKAQKGEEVHFSDAEGRKFKLVHSEEGGFSVDKRHS